MQVIMPVPSHSGLVSAAQIGYREWCLLGDYIEPPRD